MNEKKFEHKGNPVSIKDSGEFMAKIGGKEITAPSFAALKKKLDRIQPFKSFEGFSIDYDGDIEKFTVIGVKKHRRYNSYGWITSNGRERGHVYVSTPENLAIAKKLAAENAKQHKIHKAYEKLKEDLTRKLVRAPMPGEMVEESGS